MIAGSPPPQDELVAELERRESARVRNSRSPVRARRPATTPNRVAPSRSLTRAAPKAANSRIGRPAARPRRAASAPPRSPSPRRARSVVRSRVARPRSSSPSRGAATPRRTTRRADAAAGQRARSPSPQRGRLPAAAARAPSRRRAPTAVTRRAPGAAQRARSPSPQRPARRQPVQRGVRSSTPQRKAPRMAAASPRTRLANGSPVSRAAARRQAHPSRSSAVRRPTTPLSKVAARTLRTPARRSSSSVLGRGIRPTRSIIPTGRRPAARRTSRIPVPIRRTGLNSGRTAAAPRRRTAAAAAGANVRPRQSRIPRPLAGSTVARPRSVRADTRARQASRIPVPVAKSQRGTGSRLCRRDGDGPCNLPGTQSVDTPPSKRPRPPPPANLPYGVGVGGAGGTKLARLPKMHAKDERGSATVAPDTIKADDIKGSSNTYRRIAEHKRIVWAGPGKHAVYPAGQPIGGNPQAGSYILQKNLQPFES